MRNFRVADCSRWIVQIWGPLLLSCAGCEGPAVCRAGQVATPMAARRHESAGYLPYAHAHNDYEHHRPLMEALQQRFYSVEADVYFDGGNLSVAHNPWGFKGSLQQLYLAPLQQRVDALGSVHGDGITFTLWIDLKEGSPELVNALHALLERYPMLTHVENGKLSQGPVTVVLTGDARGKEDFTRRFATRRAVRDSNQFSLDDPPADHAWRYYALSWSMYVGSSSSGELDAKQRAKLGCLIENAHALGRSVRFYGGPDNPESWKLALQFGIDFINTDDLTGLRSFLEEAP